MASSSLWQRFQQNFLRYDDLGFSIDISRMKFPDDFFEQMRPKIEKAFASMLATYSSDGTKPRKAVEKEIEIYREMLQVAKAFTPDDLEDMSILKKLY